MDKNTKISTEEELKQQKHFFEQMFLQSSVSTQILDKDGWCLKINPKLTEIFGVKPEDIEGRKYNIFQDKEIQRTVAHEHLKKVFKKGTSEEWEVLFDIGYAAESQNIKVEEKKKVWYKTWAYPIFDIDGNLENVIVQHLDITQQKELEVSLREATEKMNQAQKFAKLGSWTWYIKTNKLEWSDEMYNIFGIKKSKFTGNLADVIQSSIHPDDRKKVEESNKSVIEKGEPIPVDYRIISKDGKEKIVHAEAGVLEKDKDGKPHILRGIVQDITDRVKIEKQLKENVENLEKINKAFVNRELKMIELKKKIKELS